MTRALTDERYLFVLWQPAERVIAEMGSTTMITGAFWHAPGSVASRRRAYLTILRRPEDWPLDDVVMSEEPTLREVLSNFLARHFHQLSPDGYAVPQDDADVLPRALAVLDEYDFVGIHEEFGWPPRDAIPRVNRARQRQGLEQTSPEVRARPGAGEEWLGPQPTNWPLTGPYPR